LKKRQFGSVFSTSVRFQTKNLTDIEKTESTFLKNQTIFGFATKKSFFTFFSSIFAAGL